MLKNFWARSPICGSLAGVLAGMGVLLASHAPALAQAEVFATITEIELPVGPGALEPSLFATQDGRILMSWTEPAEQGFVVLTAIGDKTSWSESRAVVQSDKLFVNWADYPSVAAFADGTLAVHWLMENGPSSYNYDVNIALSRDGGRTWGEAVVPHRDGTRRQHGFATLLPVAGDRLMVIWLDGRAYDIDATDEAYTNAAQLRTTMIGADGSLSDDTLLDVRTCTCCQTSAAVTGSGAVLVAYRDRTVDEVRDISLVRLVDGEWSEPVSIHTDGWEISGCPVNGPAIDTSGERAVVAWFTAAQDEPMVKVVFSGDAGESFGDAARIDLGEAAGRVDVVQLRDGSALASWVEWRDGDEALLVCRVWPGSGCGERQMITLNAGSGSINFPRMVGVDDGVYIAWTQPAGKSSGNLAQEDTIRMVFAALPAQ